MNMSVMTATQQGQDKKTKKNGNKSFFTKPTSLSLNPKCKYSFAWLAQTLLVLDTMHLGRQPVKLHAVFLFY